MLQAGVSTGVLDQVLQEFLTALQGDYSKLQNFAHLLFYYLAGIQIVVSAIWLMFKSDPIEATVKVIQILFTISVFYTLVQFGGQWMPQIINGFISIGSNSAGIQSLTPSSVLSQGVSIVFSIMDNVSRWGFLTNPFGSFLTSVILISILIIYALLAAEMAIILVKSYVLISISGLMFAFGANEVVRPMALNYFKAIVGIGLQLLTFYLIMGVGVKIGHEWAIMLSQASHTITLKPYLIVLAAVIVFYMIVKNVPPFVAGLSGVSGFRSYGDAAVGTAMTAAAMTAKVATGGVSGGISGFQKTAQVMASGAQMGQSAHQGMKSGMSFGQAMSNTAKQTAGAGYSAIKDSVMKANENMSFGQKFRSQMASRMAQSAAQTTKAQAPQGNFQSNQVNHSKK